VISPRFLRAGLVLVHPGTAAVRRVIVLQYNPHTISRSLQVKGVGETADRSEALRLKGPAVETIKLEAELDAADQLADPSSNPVVASHGLGPALAALEGMVNPTSLQLATNDRLASAGTLEIAPMEALLPLFVWSRRRILPVRVTEMSIVEEAFDRALNPIRAKVSLSLRVLSVDDLGFRHRGGTIFMAALQAREALAGMAPVAALSDLGVTSIP
jgi:hypothetical protein